MSEITFLEYNQKSRINETVCTSIVTPIQNNIDVITSSEAYIAKRAELINSSEIIQAFKASEVKALTKKITKYKTLLNLFDSMENELDLIICSTDDMWENVKDCKYDKSTLTNIITSNEVKLGRIKDGTFINDIMYYPLTSEVNTEWNKLKKVLKDELGLTPLYENLIKTVANIDLVLSIYTVQNNETAKQTIDNVISQVNELK